MQYYILLTSDKADECVLEKLSNDMAFVQMFARKGSRIGDKTPADLNIAMWDKHPGQSIPDSVANCRGLFLVSRKLRTFLEECSGADIEFIPFAIINHEGRVENTECFVANIIGSSDCVDTARTTGVTFGNPPPWKYVAITSLSLDMDKVNPLQKLFRIAPSPSVIVIREDLRAELEAAGITGLRFENLDEKANIL